MSKPEEGKKVNRNIDEFIIIAETYTETYTNTNTYILNCKHPSLTNLNILKACSFYILINIETDVFSRK